MSALCAGSILGPAPEFGVGIAIGQEGDVYFAGGPDWAATSVISRSFTSVARYDKQGRRLWQRYFRVRGASRGTGSGFATDFRGNSYITGSIVRPHSERPICTTIKYDPDGKRLWEVHYAAAQKYLLSAQGISVDVEGNVYIVGQYDPEMLYEPPEESANSRLDEPDEWKSDSLTIKYDTHGKQVWANRYGQAQNQMFEPRNIAVDGAGHIYVTGGAWIDSGGHAGYKFTTLKYDADGNQQWVAVWPSDKEETGCLNSATVVNVQVASSGCVVAGYSHEEGEYSGMVTIKYGPGGKPEWVAEYPTSTWKNIFPHSIEFADTGSVHVLAWEMPKTSGRGYPPEDTIEMMKKREFVTVKYNTEGRELWRAKYKGPEGQVISPHRLVVDAKNNVYVVGSVWLDAFVIMYDSNGNQQWVRQLKSPSELAKFLSELSLK
jgi:hypothetical protein